MAQLVMSNGLAATGGAKICLCVFERLAKAEEFSAAPKAGCLSSSCIVAELQDMFLLSCCETQSPSALGPFVCHPICAWGWIT